MQAPKEFIDKYEGVYDAGWDEIRARRYARQVELGLVPAGLTLPPIAAAPAWDSLSDEDKRPYARRMEVYAGMLDNVDAAMGRLMAYLEEIGEADNTVIVFMSDNGADNNEQDKVPRVVRGQFRPVVRAHGAHGQLRELRAGLGRRIEHSADPVQGIGFGRWPQGAADHFRACGDPK